MRLSWCVGICALLGFLTRDALAQPEPADTAEAHVQKGLELRRSGDDAAALAEFERARSLAPTPRVRAQVAMALQALGRWREAEALTLQVLSDDSDPWVHEHADVLRESLASAQHHLAWLSVDCNVAGAELLVNGASAGKLPLRAPIRVVVGSVVLQVRFEGYEPVLRTIELSEGTRARESFVLVASPQGVPTASPRVVIAPDPRAVKHTAAWVTLAGGGVLWAGGIAAAAASAVSVAKYNDDSRCFVWPLSRDQRCGVDRGVAEATQATAIVALVAGAVAVGAGVVLLAMPSGSPGVVGASTMTCGVGLVSVGCAGRF